MTKISMQNDVAHNEEHDHDDHVNLRMIIYGGAILCNMV
jgi:hypothetical protein